MNEAELNDLIARAKSTATLNYTKGYDFMIETYDWSDWADLVNDNQTWGKIYNEMKQRVKNEKLRIKVGRENSDADARDAKMLANCRANRAAKKAEREEAMAIKAGRGSAAAPATPTPAPDAPAETKEKAKATRGRGNSYGSADSAPAPKGSTSASPEVKIYSSIAEAEADEDLAEEEEAEADTRVCLANQIKKYVPTYIPSATHSGTKSKICGDAVSKLLEGKSLADVFNICGAHLNMDLRTRWLHLNVGQQRMCAGNMLRAAIKRGDVTLGE